MIPIRIIINLGCTSKWRSNNTVTILIRGISFAISYDVFLYCHFQCSSALFKLTAILNGKGTTSIDRGSLSNSNHACWNSSSSFDTYFVSKSRNTLWEPTGTAWTC